MGRPDGHLVVLVDPQSGNRHKEESTSIYHQEIPDQEQVILDQGAELPIWDQSPASARQPNLPALANCFLRIFQSTNVWQAIGNTKR